MKRVEIDPKILADTDPIMEKKERHEPVVVSQDRPESDKKTLLQDQPQVMQQPKENLPEVGVNRTVEKLPGSESMANTALSKVPSLPETLLEPMPKVDRPALITSTKDRSQDRAGSMAKEGQASSERSSTNFSNLDELLNGTASLSPSTAPILMPTDLLFEYDSDSLRKEAAQSLSKLGDLIRKNGRSSFRIEGHTDAFGSDNYNNQLSLRRAEAVKAWVIRNAGLDPQQITTAGLGKKHLLAPATGSVAEQQLNRRVEIVITTR
jgi:outer membrane protein OmpA-like peptidoglycan-associated protein